MKSASDRRASLRIAFVIDAVHRAFNAGSMTTKNEDTEGARWRSTRVEIRVKGTAHGEQPVYGTLTNLSRTGAFLQSVKSLKIGTELNLSFVLPDSEGSIITVDVRGEVKHRGRGLENGVGVRFFRLSHDGALAIDRFLSRRDAAEEQD